MEAQAFAKGKKIQGMLKGEKWFASENENGNYMYATFVTTRNGTFPSRWPYASVTYISQDGLEPYLTYQTMNTTSMGTFNVGDFNGNLIYTYNDFCRPANSACGFAGVRRIRDDSSDQYDTRNCYKSISIFNCYRINFYSTSSGEVCILCFCAGYIQYRYYYWDYLFYRRD